LGFHEDVAVEAIEAPDDLPRDLEVVDLVLAHGNLLALHDRDVHGLQDGIAEEAVVGDVALGHVPEALLEGRDSLEPAERGDHAEEECHLGDLGHVGLPVEGRARRVDPRREEVEDEGPDVAGELIGPVEMRGEHVPVGDEVERFSRLLEPEQVEDVAEPVADVHGTGRTVAREDARRGHAPDDTPRPVRDRLSRPPVPRARNRALTSGSRRCRGTSRRGRRTAR
jgi:hypothetical protein